MRVLAVQVCDFGLALPLSIIRRDGRFAPCSGRRGTPFYFAPEVFSAKSVANGKVRGLGVRPCYPSPVFLLSP